MFVSGRHEQRPRRWNQSQPYSLWFRSIVLVSANTLFEEVNSQAIVDSIDETWQRWSAGVGNRSGAGRHRMIPDCSDAIPAAAVAAPPSDAATLHNALLAILKSSSSG
jgi:hypothetical protein